MKPFTILQTLATIQGEGVSIGKPILLIRTNGCILKCSFCDTSWANDQYNDLQDFDIVSNNMTPYRVNDENLNDFIEHLNKKFFSKYKIKTIVFSGGEPLLVIDSINDLINTLKLNKLTEDITFEIETNGILLPSAFHNNNLRISELPLRLNISPKIVEYPERYESNFFNTIKEIEKIDHTKIFFKFVYCPKYGDQINNFVDKLKTKCEIVISPLTPQHDVENFIESYRNSCLHTLAYCLKNGYRYTPREHIFLFGANRNEFDY